MRGRVILTDMLNETVAKIGKLDEEIMEEIRRYHAGLTKPPGSLGILEDIAVRLGGIYGCKFPEITKKSVVIMAADHGVTDEGVSAFPREVTAQMVLNFINGGAAVNVLARHAGAEIMVVDVGVATGLENPKVLSRRVKPGTLNMAAGPAMSNEEAVKALSVGIEIAADLAGSGYQMLATGEMGIGNTTASSAIMASLLGLPVSEVTGRGTGLSDQALSHKQNIIRKALTINQPDPNNPLDVVAKVGGLEIAALTGLILGAAANRVPVVIDGFISSTAALVASRIAPGCLNFAFASHCSAEMAHRRLLQELNLKPILELEMRLGEGTGAVLAFQIMEAAVKILKEMATFESAGISSNSNSREAF
jgi:nicotinate-nucleotide--dimethylbenzimidazole phosphoribosyltransferase